MKLLPSLLISLKKSRITQSNIALLARYLVILAGMMISFSVLFHFIMAFEGREFSWLTGFYWTMVVMSTLGFGDITFSSDIGRAFTVIVLVSGVVFLLILLPFIFIKFFFAPWTEAQARNRTPRELPAETAGHFIITSFNPLTAALVEKLTVNNEPYVVIVDDHQKAIELYDMNIRVAVGAADDPETYRKMRIHSAKAVVASMNDQMNTNITITVRECDEKVPIIATADSSHSVNILTLAGCSRVLEIPTLLGGSLAGWTMAGECRSTIVGRYRDLVIAHAPAIGTPLVGQTIAECGLRDSYGLSVVGIWERGTFRMPHPTTVIERTSVLVLAGTKEGIAQYDEVYSFYHICAIAGEPVIIVGSGRVGQAIAERFKAVDIPYLIIEKDREKTEAGMHHVFGDAADIRTLKEAWFEKAPAALVTTHDDATNIYLTKYLRSLRGDMQILSRASEDRNVSTLHRAGADFVMSSASLGANAIYHFSKNEEMLLLAEGVNFFHVSAPKSLAGRTLGETGIREKSGCTVVGIQRGDAPVSAPAANMRISMGDVLVLIGTDEGERSFRSEFSA